MAVRVSRTQQGNGVLKHLQKPWAMDAPEACFGFDYVVAGVRALFISVKFHASKQGYLKSRLAQPQVAGYGGPKVLVCLYDAVGEGMRGALEDINKRAFDAGFTCLVGWGNEDCAKHLDTLRRAGAQPPQRRGRHSKGAVEAGAPTASTVLRLVPKVNTTDADRLAGHFKSFGGACLATEAELLRIPGLGGTKVEALRAAFTAPLVAPVATPTPLPADSQTATAPLPAPSATPPSNRPVPFVAPIAAAAAPPRPVPFVTPASNRPMPFVPPPGSGPPAPAPAPPDSGARAAMLNVLQKRGRDSDDDDDDDALPAVEIKRPCVR